MGSAPHGGRGHNGWALAVAIITVVAYALWAGASVYTFTHLPPIPREVVTSDGKVLFTYQQIVQGKYLYQKYGLADYGSVLGFGGYFGIDFTSYTMQLWEEYIASSIGLKDFEPGNVTQVQLIKPYMEVTYNKTDNVMVLSPALYNATQYVINYYSAYLGNESAQNRLKPDYITNRTVVTDIVAFFTWTALISMLGYTNGFPYMPGLVQPTTNVYMSTNIMVFVFMVGVFVIGGFIVYTLLSYWRDPVAPIQLPAPNRLQRSLLWALIIVILGAAVQGLLGEYTMHLYASPSLYGLNTLGILPFNVSRALHYTLAVLWIADTWVILSLFLFPYLGLQLSKAKAWGITAGVIVVSLVTLIGIWLNYLQVFPYSGGEVMLWFMFGGQGRDVVTQGTVYLLTLAGLLFYLAYLWIKVGRATVPALQTLSKILGISIAGNAAGIVLGALPVIHPWWHYTIDEYFRWITIHSFVESFWPAIIVTILAMILVVEGLVPVRLANAVVGFDAGLDIISGLIGTGHHYYWGGQPWLWLYVGSAVSLLEVIPIGFAIVYAFLIWKRGEARTELQRTTLYVTLIAAIGGAIGVAAFGGGLLNAPILNYFLHDSQVTMAHAHLAFPLAFGLPTILTWVVMFYLAGAIKDAHLRWVRWGSLLYGVGFYLQALLSLTPLGFLQYAYTLKYGYWYAKSLEPLPLDPGMRPFWQLALSQDLVWIRMLGDLVASLGFVIIGLLLLFTFKDAVRAR